MSVIPVPVLFQPLVKANYVLSATFYWSVYRPDLMPSLGLFIIGLLYDLLTGGIVGLTPTILIGVYGIVISQRRFFLSKPFSVLWCGFFTVAVIAGFVEWVIACFWMETLLSLAPALWRYGTPVLLFPITTWLFIRTHRCILLHKG